MLGAFSPEEEQALPALVDRAIAGIEVWEREGAVAAMNLLNGDPARLKQPGNDADRGNTK